MSTQIICFDILSGKEGFMNRNRKTQLTVREPVCSILASDHIATRVYYPGRVFRLSRNEVDPRTSLQDFEAVYENAMGFLEKIQSDEAFQ